MKNCESAREKIYLWYYRLMRVDWRKLIFSVGICLLVGFGGSIFTASAIPTWYATLNKPVFSPPNYLFAPVWTTLYILMGLSLYLVWVSKSKLKSHAMNLFWIQLTLNFSWSLVFFGLHNPVLAFVDILALWVFIFLTIKAFLPISKNSGYLLYPYLAWVSFATVLNFSILLLN
ncbi:MAG: TspO/MBR family protein [bacterium]|nr:TspO/MBR family protein [bacterium]